MTWRMTADSLEQSVTSLKHNGKLLPEAAIHLLELRVRWTNISNRQRRRLNKRRRLQLNTRMNNNLWAPSRRRGSVHLLQRLLKLIREAPSLSECPRKLKSTSTRPISATHLTGIKKVTLRWLSLVQSLKILSLTKTRMASLLDGLEQARWSNTRTSLTWMIESTQMIST